MAVNVSRGVRFALILWAHITLLPPSAWALCLGAQGHIAFEPVSSSCEAAACGTDACDASTGDTCVDVMLVRGPVLHPRAALETPAFVLCLGPALAMTSPCVGAALPCVHGAVAHAPSPATRHTVLRC